MRALKTDRVTLTRQCKAVLVGIVALIMTLIAAGNLTNYDANLPFVQHVLAMDTIFVGSHLMWRAITNPSIQTAAYVSIIAWEVVCAAVTGLAALRLSANARYEERFRNAIPLAVVGLTLVLALFGAGFLAIGGEWFLMWQSSTYNGIDSAMRYFSIASFALLIIIVPEHREDAAQ